MQSIEPDFTVANFRGDEFDTRTRRCSTGSRSAIHHPTPRQPRFRNSPRRFWTKIRQGVGRKREALEGYLFLAPWPSALSCFVAGPISSLVLSFTKYNVIRPPEFIGLGNYVTA